MRALELQSQRLRVFLPEPHEAHRALEYFEVNKEHLRPSDPPLPVSFFTRDFWEKRLRTSIEEFERDQSVRFFLELADEPGNSSASRISLNSRAGLFKHAISVTQSLESAKAKA